MPRGGSRPGAGRKPDTARTVAPPADPLPPYRLTPIDQLTPYANNARTHRDAQVAKIAASIREFGFTNPVLIDGERGIIAGHGRVLAAGKLGMNAVPTIELAHLSAELRRANVLADNRLALDAGWDDALLRVELGEVRDAGFDLGLVGFEPGELRAWFEAPDQPGPQHESQPAPRIVCPECGHSFAPSRQRLPVPAQAVE